jgi:ketosteroid isomerase-like protein
VAKIDWEARLQEGAEAYNRGEWDAVLAYAADDIVLQRAPTSPESMGLIEGRDAVREFFRPDVLDEQHLKLVEFTEGDSAFVARIRFSARGSGSGLTVGLDAFIVYVIKADLISRIEIHNEEQPARAAAGLG